MTADPGVELPLILYGVALEVLLLLTGVVVVAVQTFFADKVSFWSMLGLSGQFCFLFDHL